MSDAAEENENASSSARPELDGLRKLFLDVKFSHKDADKLDRMIKSSRLGRIDGRPIVSIKLGLTADEYRSFVGAELTRTLLPASAVSADTAREMMSLLEEGEETTSGVLEEVVAGCEVFGYLAAVRSDDAEEEAECRLDVALVAYQSDYRVKGGDGFCGCCSSEAKKKQRRDFHEALVLNFMRVKVVEQLRIQRLTTVGQHHRKDRFRSKSVASEDVNDQEQ